MSFRELRNFCEIMRSLGYTRILSMENFRTPNFELVADILDWLLHRFEPNAGIPDDISIEAHRVEFIKSVVSKVAAKTGTKLNPRKLYGADGYAVKELLKLATLLYDAQKSIGSTPFDHFGEDNFTLNSKLADLKSTRSQCTAIVETGANLFESLQKETEIRTDREKALRFLDGMSRDLNSNSETDMVERAVMQMIGSHGQNLENLKQMSEELARDEKGLEQKIKKKRQELDRCKKRLSSLVNVRPAFMDEYEQLEQEFERYYEQYVGRFRNLDYLEHEVDMLNKEEKERMEENERALKKMQKRLRDEEWRLLRGEDVEDKNGKERKPARTIGGHKRWMPPSATGAMDAADDEDDESSDASVEEDDSNPPISVGSRSDDEQGGGHRADRPMSIGGSDSDEEILNETDEESSDGGEDPMGGMGRNPRGMGNNFDF